MIFAYPDLKTMCSNIKVKTLPNLNTSDVVCAGKQYDQCRIFDSDGRTSDSSEKITYLLLKKKMFK